jgi:hypothetical protein
MVACLAPSLRADQYDKLTYLTFSGPVQVPGAVLPAGTYTFKLADPNGSRRVIQIWDKDAKELITTLLTIPDQMMEAKGDPVVLFSERPAGEPQAVKAWFYPSERTGYEFVYPKNQAIKIAQANRTSVLAQNETPAADADVDERAAATVGRLDEQGQFEAAAPRASAPSAPPAGNISRQPSTRADASTSNRSDAATPAPAPRETPRAVGTSGQLPNTASPIPLLGLLGALSLAGAWGVGQLRKYVRE